MVQQPVGGSGIGEAVRAAGAVGGDSGSTVPFGHLAGEHYNESSAGDDRFGAQTAAAAVESEEAAGVGMGAPDDVLDSFASPVKAATGAATGAAGLGGMDAGAHAGAGAGSPGVVGMAAAEPVTTAADAEQQAINGAGGNNELINGGASGIVGEHNMASAAAPAEGLAGKGRGGSCVLAVRLSA
jgi:hypothetical protein